MAELKFNGANTEAMDDFSVIPADKYNSQIVKTDIVDTKAGTGKLLKAQFKIIDGKFKGRIVFAQYNIQNPNQQAVDISMSQIKTLCDAIGIEGFGDTNELHNKPLSIKVSVKPAQGQYGESNEIKYYDKYEGVADTASPQGDAKPKGAPWND